MSDVVTEKQNILKMQNKKTHDTRERKSRSVEASKASWNTAKNKTQIMALDLTSPYLMYVNCRAFYGPFVRKIK